MKNKFLTLVLCLVSLALTNCSSDDDNNLPSEPIQVIIEGGDVAPTVGGPNQQNQVYIDLSTNTMTSVQRDSWDLGFYTGSDFKVIINSSIFMAAGQLSSTDIDAVNSNNREVQDLQPQVAVGTFDDANMAYIDAPNGDLSNTAFAEISATNTNNYVYLVNLGDEVGTATASTISGTAPYT